jgi:hypothetical protein
VTDLLALLGSPQAVTAVTNIMSERYNHERREGRTHEEAREEAVLVGDWWVREMCAGTFASVEGEPVRPRQMMVPQAFLKQERVALQRERLW